MIFPSGDNEISARFKVFGVASSDGIE